MKLSALVRSVFCAACLPAAFCSLSTWGEDPIVTVSVVDQDGSPITSYEVGWLPYARKPGGMYVTKYTTPTGGGGFSGLPWSEKVTTEDGSYNFQLADNRSLFDVEKLPATVYVRVAGIHIMTKTVTEETVDKDLTFEIQTFPTVLTVRTRDGAPAVGAGVYADGVGSAFDNPDLAIVRVDGEGKALLGTLPEDITHLTVWHPRYGAARIAYPIAEDTLAVTLSGAVALQIKLVGEDGEASSVGDRQVLVVAPKKPVMPCKPIFSLPQREDWFYTVAMPAGAAGTYVSGAVPIMPIQVHVIDGLEMDSPVQSTLVARITPEDGSSPVLVTLEVPQKTSTIEGSVQSESPLTWVADVLIQGINERICNQFFADAEVSDGHFVSPLLPVGKITLFVQAETVEGTRVWARETVELAAGEKKELTLSLK